MELQNGQKMSLEDLAKWFNISYATIRKKNSKEKYLRILNTFADYHMEKKTICIDTVHIPVYNKAYKVIEEKFEETWHKNGIDTCSRVGQEIYYKNKEVSSQLKLKTAQVYTNRVKIELYGHTHQKDMGKLGYSEFCWCNMTEEGCEEIPQEHLKVINQEAKRVFGEAYGERAALMAEAYHKGEITIGEYDQGVKLSKEEIACCRSNLFTAVVDKLGYFPNQATKLIKAYSFE